MLAAFLLIWGVSELVYIADDYREGDAIYTQAGNQQPELTADPQYPDIVGWLCIDQIGIDYPVVQGEDNEFYLNHTYDKTENPCGSIMMNCDNQPSFSDINTILYGHYMKNGTMFGSLKNLAALKEEPAEIIIRTPTGERCYQILCIAEVANDNHIFQIKLTGARFIQYVKDLKTDALYWRELDEDQPEQFLTLVTCSGGFKLVVIAGYTDLLF